MKKKMQVSLIAGVTMISMFFACAPPPQVAKTPTVMVIPMTTESDEAKSHFLEGLRASDMGRFLEARDHFGAAVEADPAFALAHLGAANAATSLEEFTSHLSHALDRSQMASEAERSFIKYVKQGFDNDVEGQLMTAKGLVEVVPDSPRAWLLVAQAQAALGQYEDERASANKATKVSSDFVPAHVQLGNSYLFNEPRDFAKAEEHMQKVAELEPGEPQSHDLLGDVYRAQGKLEMAREAYTRAAELDPDQALPLQQRGHVNSFLGDYEQARADYDAAIKLGKANQGPSFAVWRALVSVHEGDSEAAVQELQELVKSIDTMDVPEQRGLKINTLQNIGTIATHTGMFGKAEKAIARCKKLMMEQADEVGTEEFRRQQTATIAYFEGMLAARQGDYPMATAKAEEFMKILEPDANPRKNEPAHEILGLASLLQRNYDGAVDHYQQTDPGNIYARYHLALAHEGAGNQEEAAQIFQEVASYNFNFAGYALIRKEALAKVQ